MSQPLSDLSALLESNESEEQDINRTSTNPLSPQVRNFSTVHNIGTPDGARSQMSSPGQYHSPHSPNGLASQLELAFSPERLRNFTQQYIQEQQSQTNQQQSLQEAAQLALENRRFITRSSSGGPSQSNNNMGILAQQHSEFLSKTPPVRVGRAVFRLVSVLLWVHFFTFWLSIFYTILGMQTYERNVMMTYMSSSSSQQQQYGNNSDNDQYGSKSDSTVNSLNNADVNQQGLNLSGLNSESGLPQTDSEKVKQISNQMSSDKPQKYYYSEPETLPFSSLFTTSYSYGFPPQPSIIYTPFLITFVIEIFLLFPVLWLRVKASARQALQKIAMESGESVTEVQQTLMSGINGYNGGGPSYQIPGITQGLLPLLWDRICMITGLLQRLSLMTNSFVVFGVFQNTSLFLPGLLPLMLLITTLIMFQLKRLIQIVRFNSKVSNNNILHNSLSTTNLNSYPPPSLHHSQDELDRRRAKKLASAALSQDLGLIHAALLRNFLPYIDGDNSEYAAQIFSFSRCFGADLVLIIIQVLWIMDYAGRSNSSNGNNVSNIVNSYLGGSSSSSTESVSDSGTGKNSVSSDSGINESVFNIEGTDSAKDSLVLLSFSLSVTSSFLGCCLSAGDRFGGHNDADFLEETPPE